MMNLEYHEQIFAKLVSRRHAPKTTRRHVRQRISG